MKERLESIVSRICRNCYANGGQWDFETSERTINCRKCGARLF